MSLRSWFRALGSSVVTVLLALFGLILSTRAIQAQATTAVGATSGVQTATLTITKAGTLASISALTQGSPSLDYRNPVPGTTAPCTLTAAYKLNAQCTVQYTFTPTRPFTRPGSITLYDSSGNVLANTFLTGIGTGPQVSYPLGPGAGSSILGSNFNHPYGVAIDGAGNIYVADANNGAVKEIASSGAVTTLVSGLSAPSAVAIDGAGNVYVADAGNNLVKEIVAVNGSIPPSPAILILGGVFNNPQGVAVDGSGNVYVADTGNHAVKEIAAVNGVIPGGATPVSLATGGGFSAPNGVAVDANGNVYVTDVSSRSVIKIVASSGAVSGSSSVVAVGSGLQTPQGVAVDGNGNVYVSDLGNSAIKEFLAGGGTPVVLGNGYSSPTGVAVDASGNVFVADGGNNNAVKEMSTQSPPVLTFAQTPIGSTSADSPMSVIMQNIGNAALVFSVPSSGTNPISAASFPVAAASTCPQLTSSSTSAVSLTAGSTCNYLVSFTPVLAGTVSGSLTSFDNNLNSAGASQSASLSGPATMGTPVITAGSASGVVGGPITLNASVAFGGVPPTGAVTFTVSGGSPFAATCSTGTTSPMTCTASYTPTNLSVGSYTIVASIAGDSNYNAAQSSSNTLTINQANSTISLAAGGSSIVDNSVTFTATVTPSSGVTPTGAVTFTTTPVGGVATPLVCTPTPIISGITATCSTKGLNAGVNSINATYVGDTNFKPSSTTSAITQTVTASSTTLTLASSGTPAVVDTPVTFTATLSAAAPFTVIPTGTVTFSTGTTTLCSGAALSPSTTPTATCSTIALVSPSDIITATYTSGDSNFTGSTTVPGFTQAMTKNTPTGNSVTSSAPTTAVVDQAVTFTATISPNGAANGGVIPTGSVNFTKGSGGPLVCPPAVVTTGNPGTGTASCTTPFTAAVAAAPIFAVYSGDPNFFAGNATSVTQTVLAAPTTTAVTGQATAQVNQTITLNLTFGPSNPTSVSYPGATTANGSLAVYDTLSATPATPICSSSVTSGTLSPLTCLDALTATGTHVITSTFTPSDGNFAPSTSTNLQVTVTAVALTLTVSNSGSTALTVNQTATFTAAFPAFSSKQAKPFGSVTYSDQLAGKAAVVVCTLTINADGTIPTCPDLLTAAGTHTITASYAGGGGFQAVTSPNYIQVVAQSVTTTKITAPTAASSVDQQVTFSATVTPSSTGTTLPTGSITFTGVGTNNQTAVLCTALLPVAGGTTASCTAPFTAIGTYALTAAYSGDSNFFLSSGTSNAPAVTKTGTSLAFTLPTSATINVAAAYSATIAVTGGIVDTNLTLPTGTVTFTDTTNLAVSCVAAVVPLTGVASCSLTPVTAGSAAHIITASYSGDSNFIGSANPTTTALPETVSQAVPTVTVVSTNSPSVATQIVTFKATVTLPNPGLAPTGTVTFASSSAFASTNSCIGTLVAGTATCSLTSLVSASGTYTITATYNGDNNYLSASGTVVPVQTVQNFTVTASATTSPVVIAQGKTNQSNAANTNADPFNVNQINLAITGSGGFVDATTSTCSIVPATVGLTCIIADPTALASVVYVNATAAVPPANYTLNLTVRDNQIASLSHSVLGGIPITIANTAATVFASSIQDTPASFTGPAGLSPVCGTQVASLQPNGTYAPSGTMASLGIACGPITGNGTSYSFVITTGTKTSASFAIRNDGMVLAVLGVPCLYILGLFPAARKLKKTALYSVAVMGLGMLLMQATGCSSGGFAAPQGTHAVDGTYLLNIVTPPAVGSTTPGPTVAEVPLQISN